MRPIRLIVLLCALFVACKKEKNITNEPTVPPVPGVDTVKVPVVEPEGDSISLLVRAYHYYTDRTDSFDVLGNNYDYMDSIYYNANHQIEKILSRYHYPDKDVLYEFSYNSDGKLSRMRRDSLTYYKELKDYHIFYNSLGSVDSIHLMQLPYEDGHGLRFFYDINGYIAGSQHFNFRSDPNGELTGKYFLTYFSDFHRNGMNILDTLYSNYIATYDYPNNSGTYDPYKVYLAPYSPVDTASIDVALLLRAASETEWYDNSLDPEYSINPFLMQWLSPADQMLFRNIDVYTKDGKSTITNHTTKNADNTIATVRSVVLGKASNWGKHMQGIKFEYKKVRK